MLSFAFLFVMLYIAIKLDRFTYITISQVSNFNRKFQKNSTLFSVLYSNLAKSSFGGLLVHLPHKSFLKTLPSPEG